MNKLQSIGFEKVGFWTLDKNRLVLRLDQSFESPNSLYAFVNDDELLYIGKTIQPLSKRLKGYQYPGPTQTTNLRNHSNIRRLLTLKSSIDVYALPDTGLLHFGEFQINLAAGLEDSLIKVLRPLWNCQ